MKASGMPIQILESHQMSKEQAVIHRANDYTFPYIHISPDKKVTVISKDTMNAVVDMCGQGHKFLALPDHPLHDGKKHCVYCLAQGFNAVSTKVNK